MIQFQVLTQQSDGFPLLKVKMLSEKGSLLQVPDEVDATWGHGSPIVNEAFLFMSYMVLENLSDVISSNSPYGFREDCSEVDRLRSARGALVSATLSESVSNALNIV